MKLGIFLMTISGLLLFYDNARADTPRCVKKMSDDTGEFQSPWYPLRYPPGYKCDYVIKARSGTYVEITFTKFKLGPRDPDKRTDYVTIYDGRKKNRQQEVVFEGSQRTPFKFISLTSRVTVTFISDDQFEFDGFRATYRTIKRQGCDLSVLKFDHGKRDCSVDENGHGKVCEVTCDHTYVLHGSPKIFCRVGAFFPPSSCVPDPEYHCNMSLVEDFGPVCERDPTTGVVGSCNYTCEPNYLPSYNGTIQCEDGIWIKEPKCFPDPDLVDLCNETPDSENCPFTEDQTTKFIEAFFDEMNDLVEVPSFGRDAGKGKTYSCKPIHCLRKRNGEHYIKCKQRSYKLQKKYKLTEEQRFTRMMVCLKCQVQGCNFAVQIFS